MLLGSRFLAKSDSIHAVHGAVMVKKPSPVRSSAASVLANSGNDGDGNTVHNKILLGIPNKECDFVFSRLVFLNLRLHDVLQEAGQPIQYCYSPNTAMALACWKIPEGG